MKDLFINDKNALDEALESLEPGDCIKLQSFAEAACGSAELATMVSKLDERGIRFVSIDEGLDTETPEGRAFAGFCRAMQALDEAAEQRKLSGSEGVRPENRGRKPISVDQTLFEEISAMWRRGEISARQAMERLDLKPNTFYRRIKESEENKMKDIRQAEKEIKESLKEAAKQGKKDMKELRKQVKEEAKELKKNADDALSVHAVEREMRKDKIAAEIEHAKDMRELEKEVENETKELKELLEKQN